MVSTDEYQVFLRLVRKPDGLIAEVALATKTLHIKSQMSIFELPGGDVLEAADAPNRFPVAIGAANRMVLKGVEPSTFKVVDCRALRQTKDGAQSYIDPEEVENELMLLVLMEL